MKKIQQALLLLTVTTLTGVVGCQTIAPTSQQNPTNSKADAQEVRNINQVTWHKSEGTKNTHITTDISQEQSRLVFIKLTDQEDRQSSTNIGIDNRFQVSLQNNRYSEVVTCAGVHEISTQPTSELSNDLAKQAQKYSFAPERTYYFLITPETSAATSLQALQPQQAKELLKNTQRQTHQISRVTNDCTNQPKPLIINQIATNTPQPLKPTTVKEAPSIVAEETKAVSQINLNKPMNIEILFDFDSANISPSYYPRLDSIAQFMQQNPQVQASIEGHTDSRGAASYNKQLSTKRANAVKNILVNKYGINAQRLKTVGYGESQPIANNATAEGRKQNRRVVGIVFNTTE